MSINHGQAVSRTVSITAHDLLKFTNRSTSGRGYYLLEQALDRLAGTRIKTSIATGKPARRRTKAFGLIDQVVEQRPAAVAPAAEPPAQA